MKTLMRNGRDRRSENPFWATAKKERVVLFGTDQRITSGPAAKRLHSKAGYMAAPERFAESQIPLAPRAPPKRLADAWQPVYPTLSTDQKQRLAFVTVYVIPEMRDAVERRLMMQQEDEDEN
jgi:hypothetical protein